MTAAKADADNKKKGRKKTVEIRMLVCTKFIKVVRTNFRAARLQLLGDRCSCWAFRVGSVVGSQMSLDRQTFILSRLSKRVRSRMTNIIRR